MGVGPELMSHGYTKALKGVLLPLALLLGSHAWADAGLTIHTQTVPERKAVYAEVESRTVVPARARIGGTVTRIDITEGSLVKEGDVVAFVIDDKINLQLKANDARIKELMSQLDNAKTELDRVQQLFQKGVATQSRLDQARTQFEVATNQVSGAQAARAVTEETARQGAVLAPAAGRVLSVPITLGSVVLPGDEIARIASGRYFLRLLLPERHAASMKEGDEVRLAQRKSGSDAELRATQAGKIVKIYPEIVNGRVKADVEVADLGNYFVNERVLVWVPIGTRPALLVPSSALTLRHGIDYVTVLTADGPQDVAVILGETFKVPDGEKVEILTGLHDGDRIALRDAAK